MFTDKKTKKKDAKTFEIHAGSVNLLKDLVEYLKEDDVYISRMQLDYIWSPYKDIYTKISGGIFEAGPERVS